VFLRPARHRIVHRDAIRPTQQDALQCVPVCTRRAPTHALTAVGSPQLHHATTLRTARAVLKHDLVVAGLGLSQHPKTCHQRAGIQREEPCTPRSQARSQQRLACMHSSCAAVCASRGSVTTRRPAAQAGTQTEHWIQSDRYIAGAHRRGCWARACAPAFRCSSCPQSRLGRLQPPTRRCRPWCPAPTCQQLF
jgi:hypothetical protein